MTEQTSPSRRAGLRDEIAAALEAADYRMDMRRGDLADSVLPVLYRAWPWLRAEAEEATGLPEPATGQTALTDAERTMLTYALDQAQERIWSEDGFTDEDQAAVTSLRRLAAASAVVVRRAADETPGEAEVQLPFIHVDDDGDRLDIGAVMASTYDGEAPVVYVAAEQHQGDTVATVYVRPERVDEVIAALRSARLAAETLPAVGAQQPDAETPDVRHAPGTAILCPDCRAKDHSVCVDGPAS